MTPEIRAVGSGPSNSFDAMADVFSGGRYLDNNFTEHLWWSVKQDAVYLEQVHDGCLARRVIKSWMMVHKTERLHSTLDRRAPDDASW